MKKVLRVILSFAVVLTVMTSTVGPASAAPGFDGQMRELNRHVNAYWMGQFLYNRTNRWSLGLGYMDWSNDGCSSPIGQGPYNFTKACLRHDFGYRNLKRIENAAGRDVWNRRNKSNVDTRFGIDMDDRCREWNWWVREPCYGLAETYEQTVRSWPWAGPNTLWYYTYSLNW